MADLVPDDVVEHSLGREQKAPVEAHPPVGRARRPPRPLRTDRKIAVGAARLRGGPIQARRDLGTRCAPVVALQRGAGAAGPPPDGTNRRSPSRCTRVPPASGTSSKGAPR